MIAPHLRLQPGQQALTPEQEAEATRVVDAYLQAQLSTESVDEPETAAYLRQAYQVAGLVPPHRVHWLDGPLQMVALVVARASSNANAWADAWVDTSEWDRMYASQAAGILTSLDASLWASLQASEENIVWDRGRSPRVDPRVWTSAWHRVHGSVQSSAWASVQASAGYGVYGIVDGIAGYGVDASRKASVWANLLHRVHVSLWASVDADVLHRVGAREEKGAWGRAQSSVWHRVKENIKNGVQASVQAYCDAAWLATYQFFDAYLAPNALHALAHVNARVSGYWLGMNTAVLVRRPARLARDSQGRLHHATGKCIAYHDGWGVYAWHGVRVPEKVILAPERLSRVDFLHAENVEVRRVIQERMGSRFVAELGSVVIDRGPRGTLYEVALPTDDPERVARYVQVQDASTPRQYLLRVPPTVQTAAEAVAWTFQVSVEDYHLSQET